MKYFEIDRDGKIIGQFHTEPQLGTGHTIIHTRPPAKTFQSPIWAGGQWIESATTRERADTIDNNTSASIKQWCKDQGHSEEYYINCGIQAALHKADDPQPVPYNTWLKNYTTYLDKRAKLIEIAKSKKEALA